MGIFITLSSLFLFDLFADKVNCVGEWQVHFPLWLIQVSALINNYGFIFMRKKWLATLGWKKGMPLKIERNPDGSVTVRKA